MRKASWHFYLLTTVLTGFLAMPSPTWGQFDGFGGFGSAPDDSHVSVEAQFTAPTADAPAGLFVTATMDPNWHIYSVTQKPGGVIPTTITLTVPPNSPDPLGYRLTAPFKATTEPEKKVESAYGNLVIESHYDSVTWYAPLEIAPGVDLSALRIEGVVEAQQCDAKSCLPPREFSFVAELGPGIEIPTSMANEAVVSENRPEPGSPAVAESPVGSDFRLPWRPYTVAEFKRLMGPEFDPVKLKENLDKRRAKSSILWEIILGFMGGLLLNVMPCVLPVIGLKILSFVEQAGHNRRRALLLNVWYSLGLLSVFLVLATLAVSLNLGWGHLFKYAGFNITMAAIVFVMGLSFLGIWDIPIPGFVGSGKTSELGEQEGFLGAFFKGVITTILATPCTGPFMGAALAWALNQPPEKTYIVFTSVGLGMASPYLLIGAFPGLIRFLPKPGAWMDTFKQIMGFVLLATVVYIFTFLDWPYVVPTIGFLIACWAGCWWIARTPITAGFGAKLRAWIDAVAFVGVIWILMFPGTKGVLPGPLGFGSLHDVMQHRFEVRVERSIARLSAERGLRLVPAGDEPEQPLDLQERPTVLVDCTADWCATCKTLEATILNRKDVYTTVVSENVSCLQADWTHEGPETTQFLDWLGFRQVPVLAIFHKDRDPNDPFVFTGWYRRQDVLDALENGSVPR